MYAFRRKAVIAVVSCLDAAGYLIFWPLRVFCKQPKQIRKILLIRLDHIGDIVLSTPVFSLLKRAYPEAEITFLTQSWGTELTRQNRWIASTIAYEAPWFSRRKTEWLKCLIDYCILARTLRRADFDLGVDLRGDIRHIFLMFLGGIRYRTGYGITGGGFLLSQNIQYPLGESALRKNLRLLEALGIDTADARLDLAVLPQYEESARRLLKRHGIAEGASYICVHPGCGYPSKSWPAEKFALLCDQLTERSGGIPAVLTGSTDDKALAEQIMSRMRHRAISLAGQTELAELLPIYRSARLYVGLDSGPSHIAAASGVPCVVLYSSTNDVREWGPQGERVVTIQKNVPCAGCQKKTCDEHVCMDAISVDEVLDAALRLSRIAR